MSQNRFKKTSLCATAGIALLLALVALLIVVEQRRTQAETGAVLSAFFSQEVLHDMDKWDAGRTITIVVMRNPDCRICAEPPIGLESQSWFAQSLKSRGNSVLGAWFAQSSKITRASFFLNGVFSRNLSADLRLPSGAQAVFVNPSDFGTKVGDFEARFPNNIGHFVVSHVGLNLNKTEALLYVDHFCPGLCGGGAYVLMHKVSGMWHVVDLRSTWVS
ncbi:MAG TPA: hypothetical protein VFF95_14770 [Candidatus Binatus sp.]|jgi:hypothetical protein|nr:hypothetical protein [Candidatus Binatus sp.]